MKSPGSDRPPDPARIERLFHAALELPAVEQGAFLARECGEDAATSDAVRSLLAALDAAPESWERNALELEARHAARAAHAALAGDSFGPYRIVRQIGAGGMSLVYEACRDDEQFHKRVALKFVQPGIGGPELDGQFRKERQILAQLEHPNIARLLDGGTTADGGPYLVMEYVDGTPIDRFAGEHRLTRAERLRLFLQVCDAVQYAHRNLVVHRDLKPANILVTADGTPKLLDFGIARLLDQEPAGNTLAAMTPEYASPEQMLGHAISTSSDVYSLGVLLCVVLTGRLPYRTGTASPAQLLKAICEQEPVWERDGPIVGDLDCIIRKALAKDPDHRYLSVEQLAGDLRRFLECRPVHARPASWSYRVARFLARNKAIAAVGAALVFSVAAGLAGFYWQAHRAEQQRRVAERRFEEARRLIHMVIHEIQPQLASINGTVRLRQSLIERTLAYLDALDKDAAGNPALMRELIEAYIQLAQVSADAGMANAGDQQRASHILQKADALARALLQKDPSGVQSLTTAIHYFRQAARNASFLGASHVATASAARASSLAESLVRAAPGNTAAQGELASSLMTQAAMMAAPARAVPLYLKSLAIWQRELSLQPSDELRHNVALVYKNLSASFMGQGDYRRALDYARQALSLDEQLLAKTPASPDAQMAVAFDIGAVGWACYSLHDYPQAAGCMRRNVALREKVAAANPGDWRAKDRLAYALRDLAKAEQAMGDRAGERRDLLRVVDLYSGRTGGGSLVPQSQRRYILSLFDLGQRESDAGRKDAACAWLVKAADLLNGYEQQEGAAALGLSADDVAQVRRAAQCRK